MNTRPKIKPKLSLVDKLLDVIAIVLVFVLWGMVMYSYNMLPDIIAIHFDGAGNANGHGKKDALFFIPAMGTFMFLLLITLNRFPHLFNYPVQITEDNAARQYTLGTRLIRILNACILFSFVVILYGIINVQDKGTIGIRMLPLILGITTIPVVWYFIAANKVR